MRLTLNYLFAFAAFCASTLLAQPEAADNQITVLSYNIHHGAGTDAKIDLSRIAGVINSVSPDVVSLQEVDKCTVRSGGIDEAEEIARLTGMKAVFGNSMAFNGGEYGNAVLTKLNIDSYKTIPLPGEPRSALFVKISRGCRDTSVFSFTFIATHLDTEEQPRMQALPLIEAEYQDEECGSAVLAGDLNAVPGSPAINELLDKWGSTASGTGWYTFPSSRPEEQIDYILFRPNNGWRVIKCEVPDESVASDHRAILSRLEKIK